MSEHPHPRVVVSLGRPLSPCSSRQLALVDEEIVSLLRAAWLLGWPTTTSCQGGEQRLAYIQFADAGDADAFLNLGLGEHHFDDLPYGDAAVSVSTLARDERDPRRITFAHADLAALTSAMSAELWRHARRAHAEAHDVARQRDDDSAYRWLHGHEERLRALLHIAPRLSGEDYWLAVRDVWTDEEHPGLALDAWRALWTRDIAGRERVMDEVALPDQLTIYRGFCHHAGEHGISWTTDPERAKRFAREFANPDCRARRYFTAPNAMPSEMPCLAVAKVDRADVLAHLRDDRDEVDIVVLPESVQITSVIELVFR